MRKGRIDRLRNTLCWIFYCIFPGGCGPADGIVVSSLQKVQMRQWPQPGTYQCSADPDSNDLELGCGPGMLDMSQSFWGGWENKAPTLTIWLRVHNCSTESTGKARSRADTEAVFLDKIETRFRWTDEQTRETINASYQLQPLLLLEEKNALVEYFLPSNLLPGCSKGESIVYYAIKATVLPEEVGDLFLATLLELPNQVLEQLTLSLDIRLICTTYGGKKVTSNDFILPLYFCNGCLEGLPSCYPGQDPYTTRCLEWATDGI